MLCGPGCISSVRSQMHPGLVHQQIVQEDLKLKQDTVFPCVNCPAARMKFGKLLVYIS